MLIYLRFEIEGTFCGENEWLKRASLESLQSQHPTEQHKRTNDREIMIAQVGRATNLYNIIIMIITIVDLCFWLYDS